MSCDFCFICTPFLLSPDFTSQLDINYHLTLNLDPNRTLALTPTLSIFISNVKGLRLELLPRFSQKYQNRAEAQLFPTNSRV